MKLPCAVTRDLLPLYAEELVEQETQALIEEHLTGCSACRAKLAAGISIRSRSASSAADSTETEAPAGRPKSRSTVSPSTVTAPACAS